jgi:ABC-type Mn2+/Zn2+ transport system ATPase subunit
MRNTRDELVASTPLMSLRAVDAGYGLRPVLRSVTFSVPPNALIGVVGPSGSGKTTLLRLLLGTVSPARGEMRRAPGLSLGYLPQLETVDWNFPITVRECVLMGRRQNRFWPSPTAAERADVDDVLERLGIAHVGGRRIRELSGGQQQRMFLARAMLQRPQLLLLDEPTSGVDMATRHDILHLLDSLNADGLAILLTTHDLNGIANHLPRVVCVNGEIVADGSPVEVITPTVLERTFGARMEVLEHLGMLVVVDQMAQAIGAGRQATS